MHKRQSPAPLHLWHCLFSHQLDDYDYDDDDRNSGTNANSVAHALASFLLVVGRFLYVFLGLSGVFLGLMSVEVDFNKVFSLLVHFRVDLFG